MDIFGSLYLDESTTNTLGLSSNLENDGDYNGFYITDIISEDVESGDILYHDKKSNTWKKAIANSSITLPAKGLAIFGDVANSKIDILLYGLYRKDSWNFSNSYPGLFLSHIYPGKITTSAPTSMGSYRQQIGLIQQTNQILFNFYMVWLYNWSE